MSNISSVSKLAVGLPEAAKMMGISKSGVYRLLDGNKLIARKSGKRTLILVEDLEQYLRSLPVMQ